MRHYLSTSAIKGAYGATTSSGQSVAASAVDVVKYTMNSPAGHPNLASWSSTANDYVVGLDVTTAPAGISYRPQWARMSANLGTTRGTAGLPTAQTGTGLKTFTAPSIGTLGGSSGFSDDRMQVNVLASNSDMMSQQTFTCRTGGADSYADLPWDLALPTIPAAWMNLVNATDARFKWDQDTTWAQTYEVEAGGNTVTGIDNASTLQTLTGLTADTEYLFRVRAVNAAGNGAWFNIATRTTPLWSAGVTSLSSGSSTVLGSGGSNEEVAQEFTTAATYLIDGLVLTLGKTQSPDDGVYAEIVSALDGTPVATTSTLTEAAFPDGINIFSVELALPSPVSLPAGSYFVQVKRDGARDIADCWRVGQTSVDQYASHSRWVKSSGTWSAVGTSDHPIGLMAAPATAKATPPYSPINRLRPLLVR